MNEPDGSRARARGAKKIRSKLLKLLGSGPGCSEKQRMWACGIEKPGRGASRRYVLYLFHYQESAEKKVGRKSEAYSANFGRPSMNGGMRCAFPPYGEGLKIKAGRQVHGR